MAEKFVLSKRVYELMPGDVFWFSGNWRKVVKIDRDENLMYYKKFRETYDKTETLMAKSQMKVAVQ